MLPVNQKEYTPDQRKQHIKQHLAKKYWKVTKRLNASYRGMRNEPGKERKRGIPLMTHGATPNEDNMSYDEDIVLRRLP